LLEKLVMNAPDALIVVAKLTPLRSSAAVTTYNDAIPSVVQERASAGKHIVLVDQFMGFPTSELGDGVHPNQQGYERMAGVWYNAIGKLLH
jgi:lysophospholipase L1-like esterase